MTDEERLAKNNKIREQGKKTREKRKSQTCRVFLVKIDFSHLNEEEKTHLKMLFVEAKWLYNDALNFTQNNNINDYNTKTKTVSGFDQNKKSVTHTLNHLSSQMKQAVIQAIKYNLKGLTSLKKKNHKVGKLRYKSDYESINLQQYGITYRFYDNKHIGLQGFENPIRINGANQFWNAPNLEFANAKLLNLPTGYYLAVTTYQDKKISSNQSYKPEIGIDMGIKTSITTSEGKKIKVLIGETERIKKQQRALARKKKGSKNRYKDLELLRIAYKKLLNKKQDIANKIIHYLLEHEKVYMQDENLKGWHKVFGRIVQHSVLGRVKAKLMKNERVVVLSKNIATTKYCPQCKNIKKDIKLSDRIFKCKCGYQKDRDIHAACNMILLGKSNTCGTQEINAYGEDEVSQPATSVDMLSSVK